MMPHMIKKTRIVLEDGENKKTDEFVGGIPLSKGELVCFHPEDSDVEILYEVADKIIDCTTRGEDITVNITYVLRKRTV